MAWSAMRCTLWLSALCGELSDFITSLAVPPSSGCASYHTTLDVEGDFRTHVF